MTTIDQLAETVSERHRIPVAAARDVVTTYVNQIHDDADLWDAESGALSAAGVAVVTTAIETAYANDLNSTAEDRLLMDLGDVAAELRRLAEAAEQATERRDELVRTLMTTAVGRDQIAAASGLKLARLYQIRDRRR